MMISSTFWIPDLTNWWYHQEEMHTKNANLSNAARNIFFIVPHGVGVEASFSLQWGDIGWRKSTTTGDNLCAKVIVRQLARRNHRILTCVNSSLNPINTENDSEMKSDTEGRNIHWVTKVYDALEMWQGTENPCAIQKQSCAENKQMTAVGYI